MARTLLSIDLILALLEKTPATLKELTQSFDDAELRHRVEPNEWSLVEILAHLRASADARGDQRIERMLAQDEPTLHTVSPRNWSSAAEYAQLPYGDSWAAYSEQRERLLGYLRPLGADAWQRGAFLTGIRPVRRETVHSEADALVRHEVRHLQQLKRTAARLRSGIYLMQRSRRQAPMFKGRTRDRL